MDRMNIKKDLLKNLKKEMLDSMGKNISPGSRKVTVAADSKEGLLEGLDKAEEVVKEKMEDHSEEDCENSECEMHKKNMPEEMESDEEDMVRIPRSLYEKMMKMKMD